MGVAAPLEDGSVTHGICLECADRLLTRSGISHESLLQQAGRCVSHRASTTVHPVEPGEES
jgi:hypothetical protein